MQIGSPRVAELALEPIIPEAVGRDLTFHGLVGMMDLPRPEAREAVHLCKTAGITPVMITGDHPTTARTIGRLLGIIDDSGEVLTGRELALHDEDDLKERVEEVRIYARWPRRTSLGSSGRCRTRGNWWQ